jgi:glycosyltransferase involved in cell wall biosynthesis
LRILIFAPAYEPAVRAGGPARSLVNLVRQLEGTHAFDVVTRDRDLGESEPYPGLSGRRVTRGRTTVYYLDDSSPAHWRSLVVRLSDRRYDLVMVNSYWDQTMALAPVALRLARRLHGPVLLMPRGELEPGALALKARKKALAAPAYRAVYRRGVSLVGATSEEEAANVREWFPGTRVVMTTNNLPDAIPWGAPVSRHVTLQVVFLSRISPKKGLLPLLEGLRHVTGPIKLSIVGPIEDAAYWMACEQAIAAVPEHVSVVHTPLAERHEIAPLLWDADCLALLTAGENYGHVIAEALQAGCPVITTPTTPWTDVIRAGGGEIVERRDDPREVAAVIDRWSSKDPAELADSRVAARAAFEAFASQSGPNIIDLALEALYGRP